MKKKVLLYMVLPLGYGMLASLAVMCMTVCMSCFVAIGEFVGHPNRYFAVHAIVGLLSFAAVIPMIVWNFCVLSGMQNPKRALGVVLSISAAVFFAASFLWSDLLLWLRSFLF